jgi:hypothetical protein
LTYLHASLEQIRHQFTHCAVLFLPQLLESVLLNDNAILEYNNFICQLQRFGTMRNQQQRSTRTSSTRLDCICHCRFALMIQRRRRFVQDQDARIRQQGPRNTQSLTLSSRQLTSYDVSLFEEKRPPRPRSRRSEFQLPCPVREQILLQDTGVSQLLAAVRSLNVAERHRQHSVASQNADGAHKMFEWVSGKMKKMVGRKVSYTKKEQRLWTHARVLALERVKDQKATAAVKSQ